MSNSEFEAILTPRSSRKADLARIADRLAQLHPHLPANLLSCLQCWSRQIAMKRPRLPVPLLFTILSTAAQSLTRTESAAHTLTSRDTQSLRTALRRAAHIVARDSDSVTVAGVLEALRESVQRWPHVLDEVARSAQARFSARHAAMVQPDQWIDQLNQFVEYMSAATGYRRVPVRVVPQDDQVTRAATSSTVPRREVIAYTDGAAVYLSPIASTGNRDLNAAFLVCYLVAHEYLHLAAGSFRVDFSSPRGRALRRAMGSWSKPLGRKSKKTQVSTDLVEKLRGEGVDLTALPRISTNITRFCRLYSHPQLVAWLLNCCEDGRIERLIAKYWPGLKRLHEVHDSTYAYEVVRSPLSAGGTANLLAAIGMFAAERSGPTRIARKDEPCYRRAVQLLRRQQQRPRQSVYDSLRTVHRLYLLLEDHLGPVELNRIADQQVSRGRTSLEEIEVRIALADIQGDKTGQTALGELQTDPNFQVKPGGVWLPEWSNGELREDKVYLRTSSYQVTKLTPALPSLVASFPQLMGDSQRRVRGNRWEWSEDGTQLADSRFAEYVAGRRAGYLDTVVNFNRWRAQVPLHVTLLFDLSISMEAARPCLDHDSSIARAIQAGSWLASELERQRVTVEAFGAIDGGPKTAQLMSLSQPVSQSIPTLRCIGAGGFRLGAFLRAILQRPAPLGLSPVTGKHVVFVFTDGDSGYLAWPSEAIFETLHRSNCPNCSSRHRCKIEITAGGVGQRPEHVRNLFLSPSYALQDIAHALQSQAHHSKLSDPGVSRIHRPPATATSSSASATRRPTTAAAARPAPPASRSSGQSSSTSNQVHVLVFNDRLPLELWDTYLSPDAWTSVRTPADLSRAVQQVLHRAMGSSVAGNW